MLPLMNDIQIHIDHPMYWFVIAIAMIGLMISLLLVYRRFYPQKNMVVSTGTSSKSKNKRHALRFFLVAVANMLACFSLVLFVLPIGSKLQSTEFDVLFTPGIDYSVKHKQFNITSENHRSLNDELNAARYIWLMTDDNNETYSDEFTEHLISNYKNKVVVIESVRELSRLWQPREAGETGAVLPYSLPPSALKILGDGLNEQQWQQLTPENIYGLALEFIPSTKLLGIVDLSWPKELPLGQIMQVVGKLQTPLGDNENYQLSLFHNEQLVDSTIIGDDGRFKLNAKAKIPGLFNYQLVLNHDRLNSNELKGSKKSVGSATADELDDALKSLLADALIIENIAFNVVGSSKPSVIIKQSSPSFETRQLKQWLTQAGSPVQVITKISKNKWSQQRINIQESDALALNSAVSHQLTRKLLNETDLLIMDARALLNLAQTELNALEQAVNDGLGLYINIDESFTNKLITEKNISLLSHFSIQPVMLEHNKVVAKWRGQNTNDVENPIMANTVAVDITATYGQTLIESTNGRQLVVRQSLGLGNIAISTLTQTYPWALEAGEVYYSQYWQTILSKLTRKNDTQWLPPELDTLNLVDQQIEICIVSTQALTFLPVMNISHYPLLNDKKCGVQQPNKAGWLRLQTFSENNIMMAEQMRYIYSHSNFKAWQQSKKQTLSSRHSVLASFSTQNTALEKRYQAIDKRYLWLLLLLLLTFLWIERKWLAD